MLARGPAAASVFGSEMWPSGRQAIHATRGPRHASHGGGDYAAQMLLGRLRKKGWVYVMDGEGSSVWALTPLGRAILKETEAC